MDLAFFQISPRLPQSSIRFTSALTKEAMESHGVGTSAQISKMKRAGSAMIEIQHFCQEELENTRRCKLDLPKMLDRVSLCRSAKTPA